MSYTLTVLNFEVSFEISQSSTAIRVQNLQILNNAFEKNKDEKQHSAQIYNSTLLLSDLCDKTTTEPPLTMNIATTMTDYDRAEISGNGHGKRLLLAAE